MVYRPTARVLTVLELLQSHGRLTGADLARRLEVDIRTIRHYVEMLQDLGIPVEAERGRYGAYYLRPGFKLPPLIFSEDEAMALTLSLLIGRQAGLARTTPAFESLLAKVERVLPDTTRERIQAVGQTVVFEPPKSLGATPSALAVMVLSTAVQAAHSVRLHYRSARAEVTERVFDPYGVVYHAGLWYTVGYCHLRQGQRLFRLDRIVQVEGLEGTFVPPADFNALAEVQRALATVPSVWQVEVWLETSLEEAQRQLQISEPYFEVGDNGVILRGETEELDWIESHLAMLTVPFIIRSPAELRNLLRQRAIRLAGYAERSEA
ncbi:MAG TPA: YafY family protein [Chloroflexia bacterium]|nr:YafY family protein [Chloroflexia bacterium]